jgi:hypothetical protein
VLPDFLDGLSQPGPRNIADPIKIKINATRIATILGDIVRSTRVPSIFLLMIDASRLPRIDTKDKPY